MAKIINGALSTGYAGNKFLLTFEKLECVNSETIMWFFDKAMSLLCPEGDNHNKVLLFVTDAGSYIFF